MKKSNNKRSDYYSPNMSRSERRHNSQAKTKKGGSSPFKVILLILLLVFSCAAVYGATLVFKANSLANNSFKARNGQTTFSGLTNDEINSNIDPLTDTISILILGIDNNDERGLDTTRTDSMIVMTFNPSSGEITTTSIPRDTYMLLEGFNYSTYGKINSAYSLNEESGAIQAVQDLLDIPINYYVTIDFNAFEQIVDDLGGIYLDVPFTLTEQNSQGEKVVELVEGDNQLLTGEQALAFARTRYIDNDIERGKRQQQVIQAVISRALSLDSITKYSKILSSLDGHLFTDMDISTMTSIAQAALSTNINFEQYVFSWNSFDYNGESFVSLYQDSIDYISHSIRVQLGLDEADYRDDETFEFETDGIMSIYTYPAYGAVFN